MGKQDMSVGIVSADFEKKKIAISAVISFNDAQRISYSKMKLFEYFGISRAAGYNWISTGSLTRFQGVRVKRNPPKKEVGTTVVKRSTSEEATDQVVSLPTIRKNPIRNGGRGRERLKHLIMEDMQDTDATPDASAPVTPQSTPSLSGGSSSGSPSQLLTPPNKRKAAATDDDNDDGEGSQKPRKRAATAAGREQQRKQSPSRNAEAAVKSEAEDWGGGEYGDDEEGECDVV
jgi:hypothetical protein